MFYVAVSLLNEFTSQCLLSQHAKAVLCESVYVERARGQCRVVDDFRQGCSIGGDHRTSAGHGLQRWPTESLVETGKEQHCRMSVEVIEFHLRYAAAYLDALSNAALINDASL